MCFPLVFLWLSFAACSAAGGSAQVNPGANAAPTENRLDTVVVRIHSAMSQAMGGSEAWERARYVEFVFLVLREDREVSGWSHRWDRWRGNYRPSRNDSLLTFACARHIDDSYWLIMPYKWRDPGVSLTYQGAAAGKFSIGQGWQQFGPIMLATEKPSADGTTTIRFEGVRVETSVPGRRFTF